MDIDQLTKSQFVLLILLVSFVTSVATGIVTVTLVNQAPAPITEKINRVVEKTIEKVVPQAVEENDDKEENKIKIVSREEIVVGIIERISPAVVSIVATKDIPVFEEYYLDPFGGDEFFRQFFSDFGIPQYRQKGTEKQQISSGTGFFVSSDGFVLTNRHVVADTEADYSIVLNDGRQMSAEVLGRDSAQDIAVLKIDGEGFKYVPLGNSNNLKVGQTVVAIGNTLGEFQNTVSMGVVSGLNRTVLDLQSVIQTDAAINPGNSGGPLLNLLGEAIGINTAMAQGAENVGFALPVNIAKKAIDDTKEFGRIRYAFLGVRYVAINTATKEERELSVDYGILILKGPNGESAVFSGSPAEKAGLKEGDMVLEFDGTIINQENTLANLIIARRVGDTVNLKILRDNEELEISITLDERPETL